MPHSAEFWEKKSFICDSAICHLVWNSSQKFPCHLRAMWHRGNQLCAIPHCGKSQIRTMWHSAKSIFVVESNRISLRIRIYIQTHFSPLYRLIKKNRGSKISWNCPFYILYIHFNFKSLSPGYVSLLWNFFSSSKIQILYTLFLFNNGRILFHKGKNFFRYI
jgi:hypothetical protein